MKPGIALLICAALPCLAAAAAGANFEKGYALAQEKGCFECHQLGYRDAGPSFREIARHYHYNPMASIELAGVVRRGSFGHWGERFVMWPQPRLSDEEVHQLVDWVLAQ